MLSLLQSLPELHRLLENGGGFAICESPKEFVVLPAERKQISSQFIDLGLVACNGRVRCGAVDLRDGPAYVCQRCTHFGKCGSLGLLQSAGHSGYGGQGAPVVPKLGVFLSGVPELPRRPYQTMLLCEDEVGPQFIPRMLVPMWEHLCRRGGEVGCTAEDIDTSLPRR